MAREEEKFDEEAFTEVDMQSYTKDYSEEGLWDKLVKNVQSIGLTLIYKALQLYYVTKNPECPVKVKLDLGGDDHLCPGFQKTAGNACTDAFGAAGDQHHFTAVVQPRELAHDVLLFLLMGPL